MVTNRKVVLRARPRGRMRETDFAVVSEALGDPPPGMVLVEVSHISIDAFIRTTLNEESFHAATSIGAACAALGVGRIVASGYEPLRVGDWVSGVTLAQTHAMMPGAVYQKIDTTLAPPSVYLGLLGMTTGLTAYVGMLEVAQVKAGDTVVVSGAAGAVGSVACQLAKIRGARVIGIAGGAAKARYVTQTLGADAAVDYKNDAVAARLTELAPSGIDVYFDNVGGELLDTVLDRIATGARVVICGAISQYEHLDDVRGPKLYLRLAERNARMCGFTVDHHANAFPAATAQLVEWMRTGRLVLPEHVERGIDRFPAALIGLFDGGHVGKMLVVP